jgi:glycosyltransferase involved in cell wall biosynthesis
MNKKIINSNCPEFGYELLSALPYTYSLYLKNELQETISAFDTSCLYFFSPKHTETNCQRSWDNMNELWNTNFPNINIHRSELDWDLFSPPPLKEYYKDKSIDFDKEKIIIFNRYNKEWGGPPINYLDLNTLDKLFNLLSDEYQIIYINLTKNDKYFDGAKPLSLNDETILKKYPKVLTIYDVINDNPGLTYNETQLRLFSNCSKFISSNGGQLILSAYFGGENIIFSKKCRELDPKVNSFYRWYHKLGGGTFQHIDNYNDLIQLVTEKWVDKKPLINILVRTSGRPNYFKDCINSIYNQSYKNWNIIVGVDDLNSKKYVQPIKGRFISYDYTNYIYPKKPNLPEYGVEFKYNLYLNDLQKEVNDGYIIYLDDDDKLWNNNSLKDLVNVIRNDDDLIFWKVRFPNRLVPSDNNFYKSPVLKDISGIGFAFHNKYKINWEPFKRGDFRVANTLYDSVPNKIFLNKVITGLQRSVEDGLGRRDDKNNQNLSIIIPTFNNIQYIDECINSIIESSQNYNVEILVGIDSCEKTLNHIKNKTYPDFIKFYYFKENVGPYIIKNSLTQISNSDKLLFFDSDDIITKPTIGDVINNLKTHNLVRLKYQTYVDGKINNVKHNFGEGVIGINKDLFLKMNGYEPWRVAADSDLMGRIYKIKPKIYHTQNIAFYYRQHPTSLTKRPDTGMGSQLRLSYFKQNKIKKGNPSKLHTTDFDFVDVNTYTVEIDQTQQKQLEEQRRVRDEKLNSVFNKTVRKTVEVTNKKGDPVIIDRLDFLYRNNSEPTRIIKPNIPQDRQELINQKNNTNKNTIKKMFDIKPNHREGKNFITLGGKINK